MNNENNKISDEEMKKLISERINELMHIKGYDKDVAVYENTGITQSRFSSIRNKKAIPTVLQLYELAKFFDVPMEYFIDPTVTIDGSKKIDWTKLTYRQLIEILIDMDRMGFIERIVKYDEENVLVHDENALPFEDKMKAETVYTPDGFGYIFGYEYINQKLEEWQKSKKPFEHFEHDYDLDTLQYLKKGFLNSVKDDVLIEYEEFPFD